MAAVIPLPQTSKWAKRDNQPPVRQPNQTSRTREYLTPNEVERMIVAARRAGGRLAERDALLIMMAYRHGLRPSELIALRWDQIDLKTGTLHVARLKHGSPSTHPLRGPELRALRAWKREQGDATPYVFTSLRGGPMTRRTVHHVVAQGAQAAGIDFPVHPHMAPARDRLLSSERRAGHTRDSALPRPQEHSAQGAVYGTVVGSVHWIFGGITGNELTAEDEHKALLAVRPHQTISLKWQLGFASAVALSSRVSSCLAHSPTGQLDASTSVAPVDRAGWLFQIG